MSDPTLESNSNAPTFNSPPPQPTPARTGIAEAPPSASPSTKLSDTFGSPTPPTLTPRSDRPASDKSRSGSIGPDAGLWVYQTQSTRDETWTAFPLEYQHALEAALSAKERVVDVVVEDVDQLVDLKTWRLLGPTGASAVKRRNPASAIAQVKRGLSECRALIPEMEADADAFGASLRQVFAEWRDALDQREAETMRELDHFKVAYRSAMVDAHEALVCSLLDTGFEVEGERLSTVADLMSLNFKPPTDKAFLIRRSDEGIVLKWREAPKAPSPQSPPAVDRSPSLTKPATLQTAGDFYFAVATETIHLVRRSWSFRFNKGRYLMAGVVRADTPDQTGMPWKGEAFLWQLNFCTINGGKLGLVAPALLNHPPVKAGSTVTLTYDTHASTLSCAIGSRRSVVIGTNIKGPLCPAFVLFRGEEITVLHS